MTELERAIRVIKNQEKLLVTYRTGSLRPNLTAIDQLRTDKAHLRKVGLL